MLRVSLIGNLGSDAELRYTQKGAAVAQFSCAVNQVRTTQDGERKESTEWFRVRAMGRLAEFAQRLTKGQRVLVVGRLDISHFTRQDGSPGTGFDVWADEVQSFAPREQTDNGAGDVDERPSRPASSSRQQKPAAAEDLEDLPF